MVCGGQHIAALLVHVHMCDCAAQARNDSTRTVQAAAVEEPDATVLCSHHQAAVSCSHVIY